MWTFRFSSHGVRQRRILRWHILKRVALLAAFGSLFSVRSGFAMIGQYKIEELKPNVYVYLPEDILEQQGDPHYARPGNAGFVITP